MKHEKVRVGVWDGTRQVQGCVAREGTRSGNGSPFRLCRAARRHAAIGNPREQRRDELETRALDADLRREERLGPHRNGEGR